MPDKGFYRHYKHDPAGPANNYTYEVVGVARHTETKECTVLYRPLYENDWLAPADYQARPLEMFMEEVEREGMKVQRFTQITDPAALHALRATANKMYA